ncbi:MAG: class I SAM-dependent methyltransferase [bacterium]
MTKHNSTNRFSNRVENYIKYRPHYPKDVIGLLKANCDLTPSGIIADIGSGTGISSEIFIENGNKIYAIEPNKDMRAAAEKIFSGNENFVSINAAAEDTTLQDESVDFIIAGQAFHWFDRPKSKIEFNRILRNKGYCVLIWNEKTPSSEFMESYEKLIRDYGTDYEKINHENIDDEIIAEFYSPGTVQLKTFEHTHPLDYSGLEGRLLSSSYIPLEGVGYESMIGDLKKMFDKNNKDGFVNMEYETRVYHGNLE